MSDRFEELRDKLGDELRGHAPMFIQAGLRFTPLEYPHDYLAYDYKRGAVAPDGTIWGDDQTVRWKAGIVRITREEAVKAELFGWERVGAQHPNGWVDVRRS